MNKAIKPRPHMNKGAEQLRELAQRSARAGDRAALKAVLDELQHRTTVLAADVEAEVRGLMERQTHPRSDKRPTNLMFGKYEVLDPITGGGMAETFKVRLWRSPEVLFLKRVRRDSEEGMDSLHRELEIFSKLDRLGCKSTLRLVDWERDDRFFALVIEYADGGSLRAYAARAGGGGLPRATALDISRKLARGLVEFHGLRLVHRDIKPDNIVLTGKAWKYADFGIAKNLSVVGVRGPTFRGYGTVGYRAPEQEGMAEARAPADIYSFGRTMEFLFSGTDPEPGGKVQVGHADVKRLVDACVRADPKKRPAAAEVKAQMDDL